MSVDYGCYQWWGILIKKDTPEHVLLMDALVHKAVELYGEDWVHNYSLGEILGENEVQERLLQVWLQDDPDNKAVVSSGAYFMVCEDEQFSRGMLDNGDLVYGFAASQILVNPLDFAKHHGDIPEAFIAQADVHTNIWGG